jgi:type IV pilus assembly protein PilW
MAVGNLDLGREIGGGGRQLLAEGVEALGFAFAFDDDGDEQLDMDAGGNVLWGYDSNGDNVLDANVAGGGLPALVDRDEIRAVRIWILARTKGNVSNRDTDTYFIGTRTVAAFDDNHRRILLESTVKCRNMGL